MGMRHWLIVLSAMALAWGSALGSTPADDDPGMMDGYRRMLEDEQRWLLEQEARRQKGEGSILQSVSAGVSGAAQNDFVTGVLGQGIEAGATKVLGQAAGKVIGNLPVDDIAKVAGHAYEGDTHGAVEAYATGFVGFLSGTIAALGVKSALVGTTLVVSAPTLAAALPVAAGVGAAYLAKRGFEALLDYGRGPQSAPRAPEPAKATPTIAGLPQSALPAPPTHASGTVPMLPPAAAEPKQVASPEGTPAKPQPLEPALSPPMGPAPTTDQPAAKPPAPKTASPQPAAQKPFVIYCLCCGHELALPRGHKAPSTCPSCGRAKARIYGSDEEGRKCLLGGSSSWYWPKGARTGLKPGQWFE